MKKKISDLECPIIHWNGGSRVKEDGPPYEPIRKTDSTPNAQRPTSNAQRKRQLRFDLEKRLLEFSARIIRLVDALPSTRAGNHIAGQVLRSGTSPYGNHGEVEAAESRKDFVHKLKVCLKELRETRRWLRLIQKSEMLPEKKHDPDLSRNRGTHPNFLREHPNSRAKRKMTSYFSSLAVGRWALDAGRCLCRVRHPTFGIRYSAFSVRCFFL
jgi:four helix bundle protein